MMMKNIVKKITLLSIISITRLAAQDVHFSQMQFSPLQVNPALAGAEYDMQGVLLYRSQWQSTALPYKTIMASYDMRYIPKKAKKGYFGFGLQFFNDKAGQVSMSTSNVGLSVAYHIKVGQSGRLGASLMGALQQNVLDYSAAQWSSQYDGRQWDGNISVNEVLANTNASFFDMHTGIVYVYKKNERYMSGNDQKWFSTGIALYHANKPEITYINNDKMNSRLMFFARGMFGLGNSDLSLAPAVYYQQQGKASELLVGSYLKYQVNDASRYTGIKQAIAVSPGIFLRTKDAVVAKLLFEWSYFSVGMAYDMNVSSYQAATNSRGGFEIMLRYVSPNPFGGGKNRARFE